MQEHNEEIIFMVVDKNGNTIAKIPFAILGEFEDPYILGRLLKNNPDIKEKLKCPFAYYSAETNLWINNENGGHLDLIWIFRSDLINNKILKIKMINECVYTDPNIKERVANKMTIYEMVHKVIGFDIYKNRLRDALQNSDQKKTSSLNSSFSRVLNAQRSD